MTRTRREFLKTTGKAALIGATISTPVLGGQLKGIVTDVKTVRDGDTVSVSRERAKTGERLETLSRDEVYEEIQQIFARVSQKSRQEIIDFCKLLKTNPEAAREELRRIKREVRAS